LEQNSTAILPLKIAQDASER